MFERFTPEARKVIVHARGEATSFGHNILGNEHLLLGLLSVEEGKAAKVLSKMGLTLPETRKQILETVGRGTGGKAQDDLPFTTQAKNSLEKAFREALALGHTHIDTEHLLLGLLRQNEGTAADILSAAGLDPAAIRDAVFEEFTSSAVSSGGRRASDPTPATAKETDKSSKLLDQYGRNLTLLARKGLLDPVIGRENETERVIQVLARRRKNNPVLIGDPGVGKTAVVEGLAQRMASGQVPEDIRDCQLYTLDLASMVAGTKYRGEFEDRIKKVIKEVQQRGDIILFIDELHNIVGAGAAEGALDAVSILKPALSRGELRVIGATTLEEYRKYVEKDKALTRRFQEVRVAPPDTTTAQLILQGLRDRYEHHHRVVISEEAIKAACEMSDRYISDRNLPDKAIDLIDEAASRANLRASKTPQAAEAETRLQEVKAAKEQAILDQDFELAARHRDEEKKLRAEMEEQKDPEQREKPVIGEQEIAEIVAMWTGIKAQRVTEGEAEALLNLEDNLHERVIGQHEPVQAVARALRRARAGFRDGRRPVGTFLFLGPTGVGKTELAKSLAELLFGDEQAMVRLDMSEYMEKHAVSRLIGSPPGYIGHGEGGQLTEAVRRRPYCVVLLDELEKAHPDVFNLLLQVAEDGRLTDSEGRTVDFSHCILIMTSNIGASQLAQSKPFGFFNQETSAEDDYRDLKNKVMSELRRAIRPELLNRIDEVVAFRRLTQEELRGIVDLMLKRIYNHFEEQGMELIVTDNLKDHLVDIGYDPSMGARPLRRAIQSKLEDDLADLLLTGLPPKARIKADLSKDSEIKLTVTKPRKKKVEA